MRLANCYIYIYVNETSGIDQLVQQCVDCVYRMAEKYNMKLLFKVPFADYFQQKIHNSENRGLIGRMQGLEVDCHDL